MRGVVPDDAHSTSDRTAHVTDIILVAVLVAFFALAVVFVKACERIIGPDVEADAVVDDGAPTTEAAA